MTSYTHKCSDTEKVGSDEKNRQWQREFLMDRLRSHHPQHKLNYLELSKAIRMSMLEKRYALDGVEKSNLQKCLDSMQHCIKVTTRQGLVERLESLSRQLGLKFMEDSSGLFISSDMFFLEIILDSNGMLTDVKVHHECKIEQQSCSELVTCLLKGDFADFTNQLEGLSSIYQLNAEPKVKSKAFVALQAVETDLYNLFKWQSLNKDMPTLLKESPVGIVQKRRGGHAMKLTYFISSYNLLSLKSKTMLPLTMELLKNNDIGMNVSVHLEASSANKLQIVPSVTFSKDNFPIYSQLSQNNSTLLPATFVLRLNEPLPVCNSLLTAMGQTEDSGTVSGSILHLTVQVASKGIIKKSSKELFVSLPDQNHCYFFTENKNMHGSIITSVPFTEPSQVPKMLSALKQQALFYTFLASCVRTDGKLCNLANTTMLEVNAISLHKISVALQHSNEDSLVSVEFEFKDISNINVKLFAVACTSNYEIFNQKLTKIAAATLSIPLTIRYLLKLWKNEQDQSCNSENGKFDLSGSNSEPNVNNNRTGNRCVNFRDTSIKYERNNGNSNENNSNSDNLFSSPTFFNTAPVTMTSADLFSETNILNTSSPNLIGIKTEQIKDFTSASLQQEDFCRSPKSNKIPVSSISNLEISVFNSLGKQKNLQTTNFNISNSDSSLVSDLRFEVSNFTKNVEPHEKKSLEHKNTVSITPVLTNIITNNETTNGTQINEKDKRLEIEIIPILPNAAKQSITVMSLNHSSNPKVQTTVKKKSDDNHHHKGDKKRRRKDNFSSARNKIGLKLIELTDSVENMTAKNSNSNKKIINKSLLHTSKQRNSTSLASGSGGKPNLTTLKSATISAKCAVLSNKSQKRKTERKDISEEITPFAVAVENRFVNLESTESELINGISTNTKDIPKNIFQLKIRKHGNLSTVINKLQKAHNTGNALDNFDHQKNCHISQNHGNNITNSNEDCANSKYMIKPSVNEMKLTINKTRTTESLKRETLLNNQLQKTLPPSSLNICKFRAQSPNKKHTGLKPGVSSGPASRHNAYNKITFYKSHSSECLPLNKDETGLTSAYMGNGLSKSSNNLHTSSPSGKNFEKEKNSLKTKLNSSKTSEKYSNAARINSTDATKNFHQQISPKVKNAMEGLIKTLNTNFQIPKLSTKSSTSDDHPSKFNKSIFNLSDVNSMHIPQHDTNPSIVIADIPQIKNFCNDTNEYKNIGKSEKDYFNNNRCKMLNKFSKLHYSKISDNSDEITKPRNQSSFISEINCLRNTTDNKMKTEYSAEINKAYDKSNSVQKSFYQPPQALSMHIIKTPMSSSSVPFQTSLLNSTCIEDDLMDEALIGIGSK